MRQLSFWLVSIAFFFTSSINAQDDYYFSPSDQGTLYLSASTNFDLSRNGDTEETSLTIDGVLGYFFIQNFMLGVDANVTFFDSDLGSSTIWSAGPLARLYFGQNAFLGVGLVISGITNGDEALALNAQAGYPVFITDHIAFEPTVNYLYSLEEGGGSSFNLNFGFAFYFAGRPDY